MTSRRRARGVTLLELVIALAVTTVLASLAVTMIAAPPATLDASSRRGELMSTASLAMRQLQREWQQALPNSLRARSNGAILAIEYLAVLDSATLFDDANDVPGNDRLTIGNPDPQFAALGEFRNLAKPVDSTELRIALHHTGSPGANAWAQSDVISPVGTRVRIDAGGPPGEDRVRLNPAVVFTSVGAQRRVYVLSGPVSFLCDPGTGTLNRYEGYTLAASQDARDSDAELIAAGARRSRLADRVLGCRLATQVGASANQLTYDLSVSFGSGADTLTLTATQVTDQEG
jgi:MSHA biogenesis protein MshO